MLLSQLRDNNQYGSVEEVLIIPSSTQNGWNVYAVNPKGRQPIMRQRGGIALYKSLDAAWNAMQSAGIQSLNVRACFRY